MSTTAEKATEYAERTPLVSTHMWIFITNGGGGKREIPKEIPWSHGFPFLVN